ncbi:CRISPR-associated ring nuclease Csm6 [Pseudomonas sp. UBA6323]|uniref:CRISPR-associated ring nuclease Csm6 n=1 Tax=Pseudomonas sp. UBA6323 TaxID=1947329 RepID=UPI0025D54BB6|nr:CRISPR-associated ring nuclease Csm6 [Pseudomonas sp. UBA6323]
MKHILLATTGESPQVVTETLYAIWREDRASWPVEIHLITTTLGKERAEDGLIKRGHLARLCSELDMPPPRFDESHIKVVTDAAKRRADDARSLEDHEALADFIMNEVRKHTAEQGAEETAVHASLAGGRKTMTFYLGYAMSLFGRRQDRLSHVLISKGFEGNRDFWFPTQSAEYRHLKDRDGKALDAAKAEVTLAPIPFIRHRQELPSNLHSRKKKGSEEVTFRELVQLINLGEQTDDLCVEVSLQRRLLQISDVQGTLKREIPLGLLELAFYAMMTRATLASNTEFFRPGRGHASVSLAQQFLREFLAIRGMPQYDSLSGAVAALEDWLGSGIRSSRDPFRASTLNALKNGMAYTFFDKRLTEIRKTLEASLPQSLCKRLIPTIIWSEQGLPLRDKLKALEEAKARHKEQMQQAKGKMRKASPPEAADKESYSRFDGGYGLDINVENIRLIEAS